MEGTGLHRTADADFADLINALSTNSELANVPSLSIIILKVTWAVTTSLSVIIILCLLSEYHNFFLNLS
jgi:hypothetical protein